ncbi:MULTISPECIES: hypothetical protein [Nocardioides]|uniref:Uncharacterized protein n=1 Tax=Nocardioides vastitatis TaxID=2568655 RepID=A0ABW0ZKS0_9ACTN|nr:hypothetical protein [Nocardioides sp.]
MGPLWCTAGMGSMALWMLACLAGAVIVGLLVAVVTALAIWRIRDNRSSPDESLEDVPR